MIKGEYDKGEGEYDDMIDSNAVALSESREKPELKHEEFRTSIKGVQFNLLLLWQEGIRLPQDIVRVYAERWPDDGYGAGKILSELRKLKTKALSFERNSLREQLLFEYEILYKEAYEAWLKSKADLIVTTTTIKDSDKGYEETTSERVTPQNGDSKHFRNASMILESIRAMAGVDEPKRIETIIKREMDLILQYLEQSLNPDTFDEVMKTLVQYEQEKGENL